VKRNPGFFLGVFCALCGEFLFFVLFVSFVTNKNDGYRRGAATRPTKLTRDAYVKLESVQKLVDLARESAKVTKPVSAMDVVEYFFLDKARKDLGIVR